MAKSRGRHRRTHSERKADSAASLAVASSQAVSKAEVAAAPTTPTSERKSSQPASYIRQLRTSAPPASRESKQPASSESRQPASSESKPPRKAARKEVREEAPDAAAPSESKPPRKTAPPKTARKKARESAPDATVSAESAPPQETAPPEEARERAPDATASEPRRDTSSTEVSAPPTDEPAHAEEVAPAVVQSVDATDELDAFERRLGGRSSGVVGRRLVRAVVVLGAAAALAWTGAVRVPRMIAARHRAAHVAVASVPHAPPPKPAPAPVAAPAPAAPLVASPEESTPLTSTAVPEQATAALTALLNDAMQARGRGVFAANDAMEAWLEAGGNDAHVVARFAYWLGQRSQLRLAQVWGERGVEMDPNSQTAWYVLAAMRLDDPHHRHGSAYEALRRCATLPGPYTTECLGPLTNGFTNRRSGH